MEPSIKCDLIGTTDPILVIELGLISSRYSLDELLLTVFRVASGPSSFDPFLQMTTFPKSPPSRAGALIEGDNHASIARQFVRTRDGRGKRGPFKWKHAIRIRYDPSSQTSPGD